MISGLISILTSSVELQHQFILKSLRISLIISTLNLQRSIQLLKLIVLNVIFILQIGMLVGLAPIVAIMMQEAINVIVARNYLIQFN